MTAQTIRRVAAQLFIKGLVAASLSCPFVTPAATIAADPPAEKITPKQVNETGLRGAVWILNGTVANHQSHGSGWILDKEAGLIVTNEHVIEGKDEVEIFFPVYDGTKPNRDYRHYLNNVKPTKAIVLDREYNRDLAILKVESIPATSRALKIAAASVEEGDEVRTVGGLPRGNEALWGIVRGEVRLVAKRANAHNWHGQMLVTDMASNPGNSGGAILNDRGEVVGVAESGYAGNVALNVTPHTDLAELKAYLAEARPLLDPKDAATFVKRGQRRLLAGRNDGAAADFSEALKKEKSNVDALIGRGKVFLAKNDAATAIADFDDALKIDDSKMDLHILRGKANAKLNKIDAAVADLSKAIRIDPKSSRGYNERGIVYLDFAKNPGAAAEDFGRAIQADPMDSVLWSNRAIARDSLGHFTEAASDLAEAVKLQPNNVNYRDRLGRLHLWGDKDYESAVKAFIEAQKVDPKNPIVAADLADAYLEKGDFAKAVAAYSDAFTFDRDRPSLNVKYTSFRRGLARKGAGDSAGAIDDFTTAIKNDAKHARAHLERGLLLKAAGKDAQAQADFETAKKLDPKLADQIPGAKKE